MGVAGVVCTLWNARYHCDVVATIVQPGTTKFKKHTIAVNCDHESSAHKGQSNDDLYFHSGLDLWIYSYVRQYDYLFVSGFLRQGTPVCASIESAAASKLGFKAREALPGLF